MLLNNITKFGPKLLFSIIYTTIIIIIGIFLYIYYG